jgi:hypothetical protein
MEQPPNRGTTTTAPPPMPPAMPANSSLQCPLCDSVQPTRQRLAAHFRIVHKRYLAAPTPEELKCRVCGLQATKLSQLSRHYHSEHPGIDVPQPAPRDGGDSPTELPSRKGSNKQRKKYKEQCPHCDYSAPTPRGLSKHITVKHGNGSSPAAAASPRPRRDGARVVNFCPVCGTNIPLVQEAMNIAGGI